MVPELNWSSIRELAASPRVHALRARAAARTRELGSRVWSEPDDAHALAEATKTAYRATMGESTVLRRARVLTEFARSFPVHDDPDELIVGRQTFGPFGGSGWTDEDRAEVLGLGWAMTPTHIVHDYEGLLRLGVAGYREAIAERLTRECTDDQQTTLRAMSEALEAFSTFVARHAEAEGREDLRALPEDPPNTFAQALQLVWFMQVFLHAENPGVAISFGRLDQYLWPFLKADLGAEGTTVQAALDQLCAFLVKCCEGEESQNAVLGGTLADGSDASNPLSLLITQAMRELRTPQPSLCVRIHPAASEDFVAACCELAAEGTGQPGFMNDAVMAEGLRAAGIPPDRAWDWAVVGCYEAVPQGDCYPNTVFTGFHLIRTLHAYLHTDEALEAPDYEAFAEGWWRHVEAAWEAMQPDLQAKWNAIRDNAPSPFGSVVMGGCIESGQVVEAGGARHNLIGVNILGIGSLVDSLAAVAETAYGERAIGLAALVAAMDDDFADEELRVKLLKRLDRYGTDAPRSNALARYASTRLAGMVLGTRLEGGVQAYPGLFGFGGDIHNVGEASPDGRRADDFLTFGVGPATSVRTTPTAVLRSASHIAQDLCGCGNPLALTLNPSDVRGEGGRDRIRDLVQGYFAMGGSHVHFNITSAEQLREAQADPMTHAELMVRVSGFSARFVHMDARWQEALIERAEQGL